MDSFVFPLFLSTSINKHAHDFFKAQGWWMPARFEVVWQSILGALALALITGHRLEHQVRTHRTVIYAHKDLCPS